MNQKIRNITAAIACAFAITGAHAATDMRSHQNCDYFNIKVWTQASLNEWIPMYWTNSQGLYTVAVTSVLVAEQGSPYNQLVPYEYEEQLWNSSTKLAVTMGTNNWSAGAMVYMGAYEIDNSVRWRFATPPAIGGQAYFKITQAKGTKPFVVVNYTCQAWSATSPNPNPVLPYTAWFPLNLVP